MMWEEVAFQQGDHLITYENYDNLFKEIHQRKKDDLFFCDLMINHQIVGIDYSKKLYDLGYKYIYIETSEENADSWRMSWTLGVLGKSYPSDILDAHFRKLK